MRSSIFEDGIAIYLLNDTISRKMDDCTNDSMALHIWQVDLLCTNGCQLMSR